MELFISLEARFSAVSKLSIAYDQIWLKSNQKEFLVGKNNGISGN